MSFRLLLLFENSFFRLPEAGGQLLSEKLKEVANHTRQFTKKKRVQFSDMSENSSCCSSFPQLSSSLESARITSEDDLSQEQSMSDTAMTDVAGSKSGTFQKSNNSESLSMSELFLDPPQTFPSLTPSVKRKENSNVSELCSDEQSTSNEDALHSVPKLSSTPIGKNSEVHKQKSSSMDISDPATSLELGSSDPLRQADERNNERPSPLLLSTMTTTMTEITATKTTTTMTATMTTTTTTTTMTTATIAPYVSMLTHLKMPRWVSFSEYQDCYNI